MTDPTQITHLLRAVSAGDSAAEASLMSQVYGQLRAIAQRFISHERPGHTLQATALVHEAYVRMIGIADANAGNVEWRDRGHFYRAAAEAMRRILIEHARRRTAEKRGGDRMRAPLNLIELAAADCSVEILALDEAIVRLQEMDAGAAEIVRFRFFAGLSIAQTAAALGLSERTVTREWTYARAMLFSLLEESSNA